MRILTLGFCALSLALAGCESVSDATQGVRDKLATRDRPHTREYAAEPRAVYAAARETVEQMGFRFVRGGAAQGQLEAVSRLLAGKSLESTQQITLSARFNPAPDGGTEVEVRLREIIEADASRGAGQGVGAPLQDSALYEAFFRGVQQELERPKKA